MSCLPGMLRSLQTQECWREERRRWALCRSDMKNPCEDVTSPRITGKQKRTNHWALWDTKSAWNRCWLSLCPLTRLSLQVGSKALPCCAMNSKIHDDVGQQSLVIYCVEGCSKVKQDETDDILPDLVARSFSVTAKTAVSVDFLSFLQTLTPGLQQLANS